MPGAVRVRRLVLSLSAWTLVAAAQACAHKSTLHASHGQRLREVMISQQTAHASSRPIVIRAEEVTRFINRHDKSFERDLQTSRQTASQASLGAGMMSH